MNFMNWLLSIRKSTIPTKHLNRIFLVRSALQTFKYRNYDKMTMSFPLGFPNKRDFFDPVAIAWAFIAASVFEAVRYRKKIASLVVQKYVIAIAGGVALSSALIGLTVALSISQGFS